MGKIQPRNFRDIGGDGLLYFCSLHACMHDVIFGWRCINRLLFLGLWGDVRMKRGKNAVGGGYD